MIFNIELNTYESNLHWMYISFDLYDRLDLIGVNISFIPMHIK
jgi:hypothetical protein